MAKYDLPAMINYVVAKTGQPQIYYSGHSQGTMIVFAELSHNTELAKKFKAFYAMGPVSTVRYMESPIKYLSALTPEVRVGSVCCMHCPHSFSTMCYII